MQEDSKRNKWVGRPFRLLGINLFVDKFLGYVSIYSETE